jgi:ABC-type amino acid transport substrate-binding protein
MIRIPWTTRRLVESARRRRGVLTLLIPTFAAAGFADTESTDRQGRRLLDVAVEDAAEVWSRSDGTGLANDIVRAAFRAGGIEPRLRVVPYSRCKALVAAAELAVCFSMSRDSSIPQSVVFADSANFTFSSDFYARVDRPISLDGGGRRRPLLVGIVRGYEYPDTIYKLQRAGVIQLVGAANETTNLHKLADGRLEAVMLNTDATKRAPDLLARAGVAGRIVFAARGGSLPGFVGFSLRHPRGADALARYNAGRRAIANNGELSAIRRRWGDSLAMVRRARPAPTTHHR